MSFVLILSITSQKIHIFYKNTYLNIINPYYFCRRDKLAMYPKKELALNNERKMKKWLQSNEQILPETLYGISKAIGWSYGQTRGTLQRLEKKTDLIVRKEI